LKKTILIFGVCFAFASIGLQRVSAQTAPAPVAAAHNTTRASHPAAPSPVNAVLQDRDETKVVRIYRGTGRFDLVMAEKLRPNLAKAFAPGKSPDLQALPAAAIATGSAAPNPEISKKATRLNNL
jgi:hypothetical protein